MADYFSGTGTRGADGGITFTNERGATSDTNVSTQVTETTNTNNAGAGYVNNANGSQNIVNNSVDGGAVNLAGAVAVNALNLGNDAFLAAHNDLNTALSFVDSQNARTANQINNLVTYTNDAYTQGLNVVRGTVSDALGYVASSARTSLDFFATETDNILKANQTNTTQLQSATVGAIKSAADATSSESARGLMSLQDTLTKLALGMGAVIVFIAYFSRHK